MLYPLSYEGLRCTFALDAGRVFLRWLGLATSFPIGCAARRGPTSDYRPDTSRRLYGWWWVIPSAGGVHGGPSSSSASPGWPIVAADCARAVLCLLRGHRWLAATPVPPF